AGCSVGRRTGSAPAPSTTARTYFSPTARNGCGPICLRSVGRPTSGRLVIGGGSKKLARNLTCPFYFYNTSPGSAGFCARMVHQRTNSGPAVRPFRLEALSILYGGASLLSCREP